MNFIRNTNTKGIRLPEQSRTHERVLEMLKEKVGDQYILAADSSVVADTGLDSVSVMDFVFELEDEFEITIPLDRIAEIKTVADLANTVEKLCEEAGQTTG